MVFFRRASLAAVLGLAPALFPLPLNAQVPARQSQILPPQSAIPTATMEDLRALYEKGGTRPCLQQIAQLLAKGKNLPPGFHRSDLQYLRGECLLAQKDMLSAESAFQAATKEADSSSQALNARAMSVLIKASNASGYRPAPGAEPLEIQSREGRRAALKAFLTQNLPVVQRKVERALSARTLPEVTAQLPTLLDLAAVEFGASGGTTESIAIASPLGERARELIDMELDRIQGDLAQIQGRANTVVTDNAQQWFDTSGRTWWEGLERIGLTAEDRARLRNGAPYLERILDSCRQGREIAACYGGNVEAWKALTLRCEKLAGMLDQILSHE
jgi:hypothetical protein